MSEIAPLFQPLTIRRLTIPNRIAMAPMTRCFSPNGVPDAGVPGYYRRRAEGGAGLITTEAIAADHPAAIGDAGLNEKDLPELAGEAATAGWKRVVDEVHAVGGKILPQFWHQGMMRVQASSRHPDVPSIGPSGLWGPTDRMTSTDPHYLPKPGEAPHPPMTDEQIEDAVESYVRVARIAASIGFDGIAIHGAHGYLIDSFLWAETNQRTDRWGGDRRRRAEFGVQVVKRIRAAIGEDKPIFFRFSQWKQQDFRAKLADTPDELGEVLGPLADAGVDLFDASVRYFNTPAFSGSELSLAGWAKKLTGKLSGAVGGIGIGKGMYDTVNQGTVAVNNLPLVLERFTRGEFDLVSVGRAMLDDPHWTNKLRHGQPFKDYDIRSLEELT
jgi:2,4-dienoyl-CoA reductase-like NADH-dependent reductase (Old Yellow Enzyme family)